MAGFDCRPDEPLAGVRHAGCPGITDHGYIAAAAKDTEHPLDQVVFCVFVTHRHPLGFDSGVMEEQSSPPRVFAADEFSGREHLDGPRLQVTEVADRRGNQPERATHSSRTSITSPTLRPHRANAPAFASITVRVENTGMLMRWRAICNVFTTTPS